MWLRSNSGLNSPAASSTSRASGSQTRSVMPRIRRLIRSEGRSWRIRIRLALYHTGEIDSHYQVGRSRRYAPSMAITWADQVHVLLRQAGLRHAEARERVIELLATEPCALSAVEIKATLEAR